jgi:hypothetical protein
MFLIAADGRPLGEVIRERVQSIAAKTKPPLDGAALLEQVLSEPDIAAVLESLWDDESGKSIFGNVVESIKQEVIWVIGDREANDHASEAPSTRGLVTALPDESTQATPVPRWAAGTAGRGR